MTQYSVVTFAPVNGVNQHRAPVVWSKMPVTVTPSFTGEHLPDL